MNSGIYKIENKANSKIYIGSTINFTTRWWKHRALLRHCKHPNSHLQAAWNKYGESNFAFQIIEKCSPDSLLSKEQYYINTMNPAYNQTMIAGKIEMTSERRKKLSDAINRAYKSGRLVKTEKIVYQYDLRGNYITSYPSLTKASVSTNTDLSHLSSALHGKSNVAGGYVWRFYKADKINVWFNKSGRPLTKEPYRKKNRKIVVCKDTENIRFTSIEEAAASLGCTKNQLYKALSIGRLLFKKYKVIYE